MPHQFPDPALGEPFLLTPGPLTTAHEVKEAMLRDWDAVQPGRVENILKSLTAVTPSHLLDTSLYDFSNLELERD